MDDNKIPEAIRRAGRDISAAVICGAIIITFGSWLGGCVSSCHSDVEKRRPYKISNMDSNHSYVSSPDYSPIR